MARKTVRIVIPIGNPDEMISLPKSIDKKNDEEGNESPLQKYDKADFKSKIAKAESLKNQARKFEKEAQAMHKEADIIIGIAEGQSINTKGTLYNYVTRMRDTLLDYYDDNEEKLGEWGFKVKTGQAKSPKSKTEN